MMLGDREVVQTQIGEHIIYRKENFRPITGDPLSKAIDGQSYFYRILNDGNQLQIIGSFKFNLPLDTGGWWPAINLPEEIANSVWNMNKTDGSNYSYCESTGDYGAVVQLGNIASNVFKVGFYNNSGGLSSGGIGMFSQMYEKN